MSKLPVVPYSKLKKIALAAGFKWVRCEGSVGRGIKKPRPQPEHGDQLFGEQRSISKIFSNELGGPSLDGE